FCYFPATVTTGSDNFYYDSCEILCSTVHGRSATNYNLGKTRTHGVGRWVGIVNTFQVGCTSLGDSIADTPESALGFYGNLTGHDS
ncbi:hypothetical protein BJ878DRAFT_419433, partial [Calycina marina]